MKRFYSIAALVATIVFVPLVASSDSHKSSEKDMIKAANALDKAFVAAFNKGDADAMAACYWNSPDVVFFPPGVLENRGISAIKDGIKGMLTSMPGAKLELTEKNNIPLGDVVLGYGLWRITIPAAEGESMEVVGRFTDVKAMRDGKWVYIHDHASAPLPPHEH